MFYFPVFFISTILYFEQECILLLYKWNPSNVYPYNQAPILAEKDFIPFSESNESFLVDLN